MTIASLEASSLTCIRGGRVVFRELSFAIEAGQVLSLEGPNGAGKTSLLRMIAGLLAPVSGTIRLRTKNGEEIGDGEERGKLAGWFGHHDAAKPQMSPRETLAFYRSLYSSTLPLREGRNPAERSEGGFRGGVELRTAEPLPELLRNSTLPQGEGGIDALLSDVGLERVADLPCQYLSAGQKKRLALARLKLTARPLWLLDEPLAALDAEGKALAASMLRAHCAAGGIAIAATHDNLDVDGRTLQLTA